jgi:hypothetical protein
MNIKDILVFFVFIMAKINERVLIESNSKFMGSKREILKFGEFIKSRESSKGQNEVSAFFFLP